MGVRRGEDDRPKGEASRVLRKERLGGGNDGRDQSFCNSVSLYICERTKTCLAVAGERGGVLEEGREDGRGGAVASRHYDYCRNVENSKRQVQSRSLSHFCDSRMDGDKSGNVPPQHFSTMELYYSEFICLCALCD